MSYAKLRADLLAAREAREAALAIQLDYHTHATVVLLSTALPGPNKVRPGSVRLFAWGLRQLHEQLANYRALGGGDDRLGPYRIIATAADPYFVKTVCIAIENAHPAARLLDLDVYTAAGGQLSRQQLGKPARRCLLCSQAAVDCIRLARHPMDNILDHVRFLLASFADKYQAKSFLTLKKGLCRKEVAMERTGTYSKRS